MLLDEVGAYLAAQGLGTVKTATNTPSWPIYLGGAFGTNPVIPDAIMLAEGVSEPPQDEMGSTVGVVAFENAALVVQVRSTSYSTARLKANDIWTKLHKYGGTLSSVRYLLILARQQPMPIGRDDADRWLIGCNYDIAKDRSAA